MLRDPLIAARRAGIPAITHARELISCDHTLAARLGGSAAEILGDLCEHASHVLANSAATLADYPCPEKGSFLYNSVDAAAFDFPNSVDPARIHVGLISSNIAKKGIADFVQLAQTAKETLPQLQFHLIGPETDFTRQLEASVLPDNLHVHGYEPHPADAYRGLNIVLNLSHFAESFGRTIAEAMAARRPVIAYRYGALPELIDDGQTGFLVPHLDSNAVLEKLAFFAAHPEQITEFGEEARRRVTDRFSREKLRQGITALYDRLLSDAKRIGDSTHV